MANAVYPKYKKAAQSGGPNVNLITGAVKAVMVDLGTYTYDAAHEFLSDIPVGARIAISGILTGKAVTDLGAFTSANGRLEGVTGASTEAIVLIIDTGAPATSRLVAFFDTGVTGLPVTPAGASYNVLPDTGGVWYTL